MPIFGGSDVLSLYEGFFAGGARILHSDVVTGLHSSGRHRHSVLSIHHVMQRESIRQRMQDDRSYRQLREAGVRIASLGRVFTGATAAPEFTASEIDKTARQAKRADVVLSLKEQPLRLVNEGWFPQRPVVVCLHRSDPEHSGEALDDLRAAVGAGRVAGIICCASSTRDAYRDAGIADALLHVVPNGVDLRRFHPARPVRRATLRMSLGVPTDATVVAFAARYDGMKNVPLFLRTAYAFLTANPDGHVIACGAGMSPDNPALASEIDEVFGPAAEATRSLLWSASTRGLPVPRAITGARGAVWRNRTADPARDRLHLFGLRADMQPIYAAADVVTLTSSFGEAAPLCLIEGMMCGAVPVATDVGDCASIVAGHGLIVAPDATALSQAWQEAALRRDELSAALIASRPRFSHSRMIHAYATHIDRIAGTAGRRTPVRGSGRAAAKPATTRRAVPVPA